MSESATAHARRDVTRSESTLDLALERLHAFGPELANGFTSHAPMVAEALCTLGRPDAVLPWLETIRPTLLPRPEPTRPIEPSAWRGALGRPERVADWMQLFAHELAEAPWRRVLARWLERLAEGYASDALHGAIRVAHAARSLEARETSPRLRELADALGLWAATYQTLPVDSGRRPLGLAPREAIAALPLLPHSVRRSGGSIASALAGLSRFADFAPVIDWIDAEAPPEALVSALTEAFARIFVANARDPLGAVVFVHGVTGAAALRSLLPRVEDVTRRALVRRAWQAGAALYACFGSAPPFAGTFAEPPPSREALIEAAVANGDDHAIKLVAACLGEHALVEDPLYLFAARQGLTALPPVRR
jgi:hypothetical protein